jgi:hypothetical protein
MKMLYFILYLFFIYLMTLAAAQIIYHQLAGLMTGKNMEGSVCGPFDSLIRRFFWTERKA